jgi:hypothetical protein
MDSHRIPGSVTSAPSIRLHDGCLPLGHDGWQHSDYHGREFVKHGEEFRYSAFHKFVCLSPIDIFKRTLVSPR